MNKLVRFRFFHLNSHVCRWNEKEQGLDTPNTCSDSSTIKNLLPQHFAILAF